MAIVTVAWAADVDGDFSDATNWRGDVAPGASDEAFLAGDGGAAYTVTVDVFDATVGVLRSAANATLSLNNPNPAQDDFFFGTLDTSGAIMNSGYIVDVDGTIKGAITNEVGAIDASGAARLTIETTAAVTNDAFLESTGTGGLYIRSTTIDDSGGGFISGQGGKVILDAADVEGGTILSEDGGVIDVRGLGNVLDGSSAEVSVDAKLVVGAGASLTGEGTIDLFGITGFVVEGSATLDGPLIDGGTVETRGGSLTVEGAVTTDAGGKAVIDGGTMTFDSTFDDAVQFVASGTLRLGASQSYGGKVIGFASDGATKLDLQDVGFAGAGEATFKGTSTSGVLTVVGTNGTAHIELKGDYLGDTFTAADDGSHDSLITASVTSGSHINHATDWLFH